MPVSTTSKEYTKYQEKWKLVRAIVENDARDYIRVVDPSDRDRSNQYKEDAVLTNFTALTKNGLIGLVFRKAPEIELPPELEYLFEDVTGSNLSINQFSQFIVSEILQTGRFGVLVDYPPIEGVKSLKDVENETPTARFKAYAAETIINYKTGEVGNRTIVTMVVLEEQIEDPLNQDKFACPLIKQYRVLEIAPNGYYCQTIYNEQSEITEGTIFPLKADGSMWDEIPFMFFGSENNDCAFDTPPLYDLAAINCQHYRNSADFEESIFVCGQPMGVWSIAGSAEQFEAANPGGILWGARRGVNVGENGKGVLLQANPNQLADTAMARKEAQAAAIGARLISPSHTGRETAEGARIRYGAQNSALYTLVTNITLGVIQCLEWVCEYMNADYSQVKYLLNTNFYDDSTDPQMLMAMMQGYDRGFILANEVRSYMRETGAKAYLDSSDARALTNIHMQSPLEGLDTAEGNKIAVANAKAIAPELTPGDASKPVGGKGN